MTAKAPAGPGEFEKALTDWHHNRAGHDIIRLGAEARCIGECLQTVRAAHAREVAAARTEGIAIETQRMAKVLPEALAAARREVLLEAARLIREGAEVPQGTLTDTGTIWRSMASRSIATWLEQRARAGGGTKGGA